MVQVDRKDRWWHLEKHWAFVAFGILGLWGHLLHGAIISSMGAVTWIRLDRGVATPSWAEMFPTVRVHHIEGSLSDHTPLWVCSDDEQVQFYKKKKKKRPFRFEAMWMKDEGCGDVMRKAWESSVRGAPMENLIHKVDVC